MSEISRLEALQDRIDALAKDIAKFKKLRLRKQEMSQEEAGYDEYGGDDSENCGDCANFNSSGRCKIVQGSISEDGWCEYFEA